LSDSTNGSPGQADGGARVKNELLSGHGRPHGAAMVRLARFAVVGASGLVINLMTFAALYAAGAGRIGAATAAFAAAVANNFWWNRRWTFSAAAAGGCRGQAVRFVVVSVGVFALTVGLLELAGSSGVPALISEAVAIVAVTPLGFLANRRWTFAPRLPDLAHEVTG
jgi:putative flippase GtrA